ncbi:MAG: hypothetical protein M1835_002054 [Candelina submexicana]|nr:MAG: hypothetical protein M1835_002054 [Candelina submexicana]
MAAQMRAGPRLYRDFLTPALHRRFTKAATITLLVCYVEAVLIGDKSSLVWSWFPLGPVGIRTLLLFISSLAIFILRVAQLHVGARTSTSSFQSFRQHLVRFNSLQTLVWYFFSAWWFSEVYVWSASRKANLNWVTKTYERSRLNERPIYLRTIFFLLAGVQSYAHLVFDYDRVHLPINQNKPGSASEQRPHIVVPPLVQIRASLPHLFQAALIRSMSMIILGPLIYSLFIRNTAWNWTLFFAKLLWRLPQSSNPPTVPPYHISLILRSVFAAFLLVLLWEISNAVFGAYVAQEPLKKGHPLTDDSRDPNGSLLTGLKARKEVPKTFAFWELIHISQCFPVRRKSFFEDIDRPGGPTWTQILNACLDIIQGVNNRVTEFQNPPASGPPPGQQQGNPQPLPRLTGPLNEGNIFTSSPPPTNRRERVQAGIGNATKSIKQRQTAQGSQSPLSPKVKGLLTNSANKVMTKERQEAFSLSTMKNHIYSYINQFLRSPLGGPFRQTLDRRAAVVVLGTPYGDLGTIMDAIDSVTRLAISSLTEDPYGKVQADVPTIIRTFMRSIPHLEAFKQNLQPHWTDVEYTEERSRKIDEVDIIIGSLRGGLREVLRAFGEYAENLGLGVGEMRVAREIAAVDEEEAS